MTQENPSPCGKLAPRHLNLDRLGCIMPDGHGGCCQFDTAAVVEALKAARKKETSPALAYALLLPEIQKAGREVGYAIAVHGSLARDLDVVAIPWTEEAVSAERLIMHLLAALDGRLRNGATPNGDGTWTPAPASVPATKPHGRLAWSLHVGPHASGLYVDVSVMPRDADRVRSALPNGNGSDT